MQQREEADYPVQRWLEAIWLLIAILTPLFVNLGVEQQFEASKVWLVRTLVLVLAVVWLGGWMAGLRPRPLPPAIRNLIVALVLILLLSTWLCDNQYVAVYGSLERAQGVLTQLSYLLLFLCVAMQIDPQGSRQLLRVLILTTIPVCLLGLAQALGWQPLPVLSDARSTLTTTLGRANFTGAYLSLILPLTLVAGQSASKQWHQIGYGTLAALELIIIALTQARAAWIAAAVGVTVLLWLRAAPQWSKRVRWTTATGGLVALGGASLVIVQRGIAIGGSVAARYAIWQASLRLLWQRLWLGYGADTLELHFPSVYPPQLVYYQGRGVAVDRAHNWLLDWSLSYGVVATICLIGLIYLVLREGWKGVNRSPGAVARPFGAQSLEPHWLAACVAGICTQLVGNLLLFEVAATAVVFWLLSGVVLATVDRGDLREPTRPLPLWVRSVVIVVGVSVVGWAVWQSSVRPVIADAHSWRGTQALSQGNPSVALTEYAAASELQPQRAAYHVAEGLTAAQLGNFAQADQAMNEAIALRPLDPVLYTHLATVYAHEVSAAPEKLGMAYEAYERAIALAPTVALTNRHYADLAFRSGNAALALKQARRAVDLDATDGIAFGILGWALLQEGNLAAAQDAFAQAVRWEPDSADFQLGLATVYFQQGMFFAARQALQSSLALDPYYPPALALQIQLQDS